jgi:MATE family multidrug resistance protein
MLSPLQSLAQNLAPWFETGTRSMSDKFGKSANPDPGGMRELWSMAWPLIVTNSFWTLQATIDRVFLAWYSEEAVAAAVPGALLFWTPFALLQNTVAYAGTFVAQYWGARRYQRIGPAVWQGIHLSWLLGLGFMCLAPMAKSLTALGGHSPLLQELEADYFRCLCFAALPMLLTAATSSFFGGRGDSRTVLIVNAFGMLINALLAYFWIFGRCGLPRLGIIGAGWATVVGSWASAAAGLLLMSSSQHDSQFATRSGWRLDFDLFKRLLKFGVPSGIQWGLDALALTILLFLIGRWGKTSLAASNVTFTVNMIAFLPALGLGQGVAILVGQRQGQNRPDLAARTTWTGFHLALYYTTAMALVYLLLPDLFASWFQTPGSASDRAQLTRLITVMLRFVAVYCVFDSMNAVFSSALRGAGDTHFVTWVYLALCWPTMILPSWIAWCCRASVYWAWTSVSVYVVCLGLIFLMRFVHGKWRTMQVIEAVDPDLPHVAQVGLPRHDDYSPAGRGD